MIVIAHQHRLRRFSRQETFRTLTYVLKTEQHPQYRLSVVFTDDVLMRKINRRFFHRRSTTDVIAFPLQDGMGLDGEVYVNLDQARRQADHYRVRYGEEVQRLLIHGTLHLLGFRDSTNRLKRQMRKKEDLYLGRLLKKK